MGSPEAVSEAAAADEKKAGPAEDDGLCDEAKQGSPKRL